MFSRLNGADTLLDFAAEDVLAFLAASFGLAAGAFSASLLQFGQAATGASAVVVCDETSKTLKWDPDRAGAQAAETVAIFTTAITPTVDDFLLI